ncbi:hypothetical protein THAPSDRAFT_2415 [Thalassiosira pseudonana CCMP1335]|uniref:Rab proteins geranylgeranyltransferase component A n=1 Tax=Thalassiosira pseudonana TaxID=35128 RepID=B8BUA8_THAPS|nr:hypothetical protein THAPSDRAFT_2415 [Thalassiosira pseudonana CCMP1335]EED95253.1 hypothetical protein THAPSDRAFT_2415 [Thalassiosira pseudonana CCMP1335]
MADQQDAVANDKRRCTDDELYDVVICGTDLVQSILSSALSRAGKKVLHCDGNEWYGGFDAVLYAGSTLDSFIEGCAPPCSQKQKKERDSTITPSRSITDSDSSVFDLLPREKYADLRLHSQTFVLAKGGGVDETTPDAPFANLGIDDTPNNDAGAVIENDGAAHKMEPTDITTAEDTTAPIDQAEAEKTYPKLGHGFSLDISPGLLFASGDAVQGLVKSGVADYLEFKSLKGLYLLMAEEELNARKGGARGKAGRARLSDRGGAKSEMSSDTDSTTTTTTNATSVVRVPSLPMYRVPCSKGDVFRSKLLSPVDKRRLMKFLQLVSDYGMATEGAASSNPESTNTEETTDEQTTAETSDANVHGEVITTSEKSNDDSSVNATGENADDAIHSINERHLHRGRALSRPQNKAKPSSSDMDALMRCVRDKVSFTEFLTAVVKLPPRLCTVVMHALVLAPFQNDETTSTPQYSTKDGLEDLLRHVTALGRFGDTAFLIPMYGSGELSQAFCRSGAVYGSTYMLRRSPVSISVTKSTATVRGVVISGEERIGGNEDVNTLDISNAEIACKHVIVPCTMLHPSDLGDKVRTYRRISVVQGKLIIDQDTDKDAFDTEQRYAVVIPPDTRGLDNKCAIHGVIVDNSVCVTPQGSNYTVLHLTTTSTADVGNDDVYSDILAKSVQYLIASHSSKEPAKECHHVSFSYSSEAPSTSRGTATPSGLHVCHRGIQPITFDSAFLEAKRIFDTICPDSDFLALAKQVEDAIVYRNVEDSDDERMVLDSAYNIIQAPVTTAKTAEAEVPVEEGPALEAKELRS